MTTRNLFFFSRGKKRKKLKTGTDWVPRTDGQKQQRAAVRLGGEQYYHCRLLVQEKQRVKRKKMEKRESSVHVWRERAEPRVPKQKTPVEKGVERDEEIPQNALHGPQESE